MEIFAVGELHLLRLLVLNDIEDILGRNWVKCRYERGLYGDLVRVGASCVLQLGHHHVSCAIVQVNRAARLVASDRHAGTVFILLGDFSIGGNTKIGDTPA